MSSRQSVAALKDWLLGTQAAPACEAGAFIRDWLATADRSRPAYPLATHCFGRMVAGL